jgi:hypothetical protein
MGILDQFDPHHDGWQFVNWGEGTDFSWDLYRRTYLAINPSNDPVAAPLDVAFYQVFKGCAKNGNCGGMSMLALALFKHGGFMGWCSPPDFYLPANMTDHKQPARPDLHESINIMQARQFSAAGIRNFLDVVKAGQLSDGVTAWKRIQSGLASGDYCLLSISNGLFGDAAHTVIPYRAEMSGTSYVLHVWNSNRPYKWFPQHYDGGHNRIVITGPTAWTYDQNGGVPGGAATVYDGSKNGWCFAIPTSLILHKGHQPISPGFLLTGVLTLFVSGVGAAITQVEDDEGRRLYVSDRLHRSRADLETVGSRQLPGVAPWLWPGGVSGDTPGELLFLERPPGSGPLNVSVRGDSYHLMALSEGRLTEVVAGPAAASARDRVRMSTGHGGHEVEVSTGAPNRRFDLHHLRHDGGSEWRSVRLRDVRITTDRLRLHVPVSFDDVEISGATARRDVDVELRRYDGERLVRRTLAAQTVPAGRAVRLAPHDWNRLARGKVDSSVT